MDMLGFGLELIFVTQRRNEFGNITNESMEFIVNRLIFKELYLNKSMGSGSLRLHHSLFLCLGWKKLCGPGYS